MPVGMEKSNFVKDQRRELRARRKQKQKKRHFSSMVLKKIRQLGLKQENGISEMAQELEDDTSGVIRLRSFFNPSVAKKQNMPKLGLTSDY